MISKFFINRPIFSIVIAIVIMLAGVLSLYTLPVEQYPDIASPTVRISATYTGASAQTVENSVTKVIEKELTGLDGLLYFSSTSSSSGSCSVTVTFDQATNPDTAQIQVQNKIQQILSRLPAVVQQNGVTVTKSQSNMLMLVVMYDETNRDNNSDVSDYLISNVQDSLARVEGVGGVQLFGQQYAMRIWLDPNKLRSFNLMPSDINAAIAQQNKQVSIGKIGNQPAVENQSLVATVTAVSMLETAKEFRNIIVKYNAEGAIVRLGDVAKVELGSEDYSTESRLNGHPAAGLAVMLASGANALDTSEKIHALMSQMQDKLPDGYKIEYSNDNSEFVQLSITEVVKTLLEAILLVIIVMYVFLQNWRTTIIPALTVPVVLLGTFGILQVFGYSINTLTLFGMVLSIGLLVDDTIVVIENVERVMREKKLPPKEATIESMEEVTSALIGIAVVLSVVFIPMIFFGGSTGIIYRQFAITIISAMALSLVLAVSLTPVLCTLILKTTAEEKTGKFQQMFDKLLGRYKISVDNVLKKPLRWFLSYGLITAGAVYILVQLPTGFLPNEDQGLLIVQYTLPVGADISRTSAVSKKIEEYFADNEKENVESIFSLVGSSFSTSSQNTGMIFLTLKDWAEREGKENSASAIATRATIALSSLRDARVFALVPPAIISLGQSDGFEFYIQANAETSRDELNTIREKLLEDTASNSIISSVRTDSALSAPQLQLSFNNERAMAYGVSLADIYSTLNTAWAGTYVNDFIDRTRIKKVYMQSAAEFRSKPDDLSVWTVRNSNGSMVPFSEFSNFTWKYAPENLERFNGLAAYNIQGSANSDYSSGDAMAEIEKMVKEIEGVDYAWSGLSYQEQESSGQAVLLYSISIFVIFLCLAALYESWSIPIAVLMVIPLGVFGAVLATLFRGLDNNVYFQMALLTTIGLSAKNAIMMVEFAENSYKKGLSLAEAASTAAVLRLRPILMTAFTFAAGVLPLAMSHSIGANSRIAIGTGTLGGTITSTIFGVFMIPLFFVLVNKLFSKNKNTGS